MSVFAPLLSAHTVSYYR